MVELFYVLFLTGTLSDEQFLIIMKLDIGGSFFVCIAGFFNSIIYGFSNNNLREYYMKQGPTVEKLRLSNIVDIDVPSSKRTSIELKRSSMEIPSSKRSSKLLSFVSTSSSSSSLKLDKV